MEINLISDTVTKPTQEMLRAVFKAAAAYYCYKQDPTVIELEVKVTEMFGMEADLYFTLYDIRGITSPSGQITSPKTQIKMHHLANGLYYLQV